MQDRLQYLNNKNQEYKNRYPRLSDLEAKLLSLGGDVVCLMDDEDLETTLSRGEIFKARGSILKKGLPSQCHANSAALWEVNKDKLDLVTGYALSVDEDGLGVWRLHSWCVFKESGKVVETTVKRKLYFGFKMTQEESEEFYYNNP